MSTYRVVAPYVTLPILDSVSGKAQVHGYYAGAIVDDPVDGDILKRHVKSGLVEKVTAAQAKEPKPESKPAPAKAEAKA